MIQSEINFHYELEDFILEREDSFRKWLIDVSLSEKKELKILNYIFCSDEYLLKMNKDFLNHDYYTDILSFPLKEDPIEGDIFISVDRVKENADTFSLPFQTELKRVMVHGLLHFLGYNDHDEKDIELMRSKEDFYMEMI